MMRKNVTYWSLLSAAMLLVGCGGGGGDSPGSAGSPEGIYEGSVFGNLTHSMVVLDDNRYYMIYGEEGDAGFAVAGLVQGRGVPNNGSFTSTDMRDYFYDGSAYSGSLSASYREDISFNGSLTYDTNGLTSAFTGTRPTDSPYDYDTPAELSNITGAWALSTMQGEEITLNVEPSGDFTASSAGGCAFDGTIAPRASGKNVFDVELTFGAAPCAFPGQPADGIAIESEVDGQRQLIIAGTTADRTGGTVIFGAR